jgi:hypothetical protein
VEPVDAYFSIEQVYSARLLVRVVMSNEDARASIPNRDKHTLINIGQAKPSHILKIFSELGCVLPMSFECIVIYLSPVHAVL